MDQLKLAVTYLIKSGIIVEQEAFIVLQKIADPIKITKAFLEQFPEKSNFSKKDIISLMKSPIKHTSSKKQENNVKIPLTNKIPRRHRKRPSIDKLEINSVPPPISVEYEIKTFNTVIRTQFDDLQGLNNYETDFKIIKDPIISNDYKGTINDLIGYFQNRYNKLSSMFKNRVDIPNITRIKDMELLRDEKEISVIGMLTDKKFSPNGGGSLTIEDPTSDKVIQIILPMNNSQLINKCIQLMNDTVICAIGFIKKSKFIAKDVILPDIPNIRKKKRAEIPVHVAFLSDIHVGSREFLEKPMNNFISFLNGEYGNRKIKALGKQTKYVLFGGDVVDGVGIYVNQLADLSIDNIKDQYNVFAEFLERIPEDVQIVIIPGNHDMVRTAEPQPKITSEHAPALSSMKNIHMLSNPSQVALHSVEVLLYHCTSLPDIMNSIPGVPSDEPVEVMKHMLKARHLAPIWGSKTPIAAEPEDHLVIDRVPDIFHGGHIHINGEGYYKGIQVLNSGTMQNQTSFQKSLNIIPTPGQITITNLKTLAINRVNFLE